MKPRFCIVKGALFPDEITSLNDVLEAKLLRLLSEQEILKLGSDRIIPVDIRILAATNDDIEACVRDRRFREDLYYRLNVFRLHIPPLRERPQDLVPLFLHFVATFRGEILRTVYKNRQRIHKLLIKEPLRGNARELENIAKRFCLLYQSGKDDPEIDSLLENCFERKTPARNSQEEYPLDLRTTLQQTEKKIIENLAKRHKNRGELSRILDMDRSSLWRKLKKYGIQE